MKRSILPLLFSFFWVAFEGFGQGTTTCPAPTPGTPQCFQTSRPNQGNPLTNWPPVPNQDCCNAIPLCQPLNFIDNGVVVPPNAPAGVLFPGCVDQELPNSANTCFSNNEKATTWYKWQIRPLPNGPTAPGSPAGKLRFKIIPLDALEDPNYDPFTDLGAVGYGNTDYDFLLFKIPANIAGNDGAACTAIRNSTAINTPNSVIASCNWTGTRGPTGLFEPGTGTANAQGPATRFNRPLNVNVGDIFYLAIDNFSVNQQGFYVDFRGLEAPDDSTAIVNPPPDTLIKFAKVESPECASKQFVLKFDRPVRCDSVKPNKFIINGLNPPYQILTIAPQGGCNPGGQDTAFVFTISPDMPDTTLQIIVASEIRDICGNKVLKDTARMRLEFPVPLIYDITGKQPSCGITELTVRFATKVYCDSVKANKFTILNKGVPFGQVTKVRRASGAICTAGTLDSLYILTFNRAIKDTLNFELALTGIIRDKCGNPVTLDSLRFRINPFLTAKASLDAVCPKQRTVITAILDSTFASYSVDSLDIKWFNLNTGQQLVDDGDSVLINPFNPRIITVRRDLTYPETVNYRVIVRNLINGCIDTTQVPILFSARPQIQEENTLTTCFGENLSYLPTIPNGKFSDMKFSWVRKGTTDTLSKDSVLNLTVTEDLIAKGIDQTVALNVRFIDSLGGCVANPYDLKLKFGRKIMPKINLDSVLRYASITPADFTFGNASTFSPPKNNAFYAWNFGQGESATSFGSSSVTATYPQAGKNGEGFKVKLTAFDTLYASPVQIGRVCSNSDSILVFVQNLIPSLVTANGDGKNDFFSIEGMRPNTFSMKLYNRWGKLVGEQDPFLVEGWDPKDVGPGTYYYILTEKRSGKTIVSWLNIAK